MSDRSLLQLYAALSGLIYMALLFAAGVAANLHSVEIDALIGIGASAICYNAALFTESKVAPTIMLSAFIFSWTLPICGTITLLLLMK